MHPTLFDADRLERQHQHIGAATMPHVGHFVRECDLIRFVLHIRGLDDPVRGRVEDMYDVSGRIHDETQSPAGGERDRAQARLGLDVRDDAAPLAIHDGDRASSLVI